MLPNITIKQLLEAGVHFGHQTKRWNPKMKEYIFGERNGIYIIDLQKTLRLFKAALEYVSNIAAQGQVILFVGTKRQAQDAIAEEARRCGMFYINQRWLGGLLTNFATIQKSIQRLKELESMKETGQYELLSKKEVSRLERERKRLEKNLTGIKEMPRLPDAIFVIDSMKEAIAIREAKKLGITVVGIVDTNCDPEYVDYVIPGNDDALKSVRLITSSIAEAIITGRELARSAAEIELSASERAQAPGEETPAAAEGGIAAPAAASAPAEPAGTPAPAPQKADAGRRAPGRFDRRPGKPPFKKGMPPRRGEDAKRRPPRSGGPEAKPHREGAPEGRPDSRRKPGMPQPAQPGPSVHPAEPKPVTGPEPAAGPEPAVERPESVAPAPVPTPESAQVVSTPAEPVEQAAPPQPAAEPAAQPDTPVEAVQPKPDEDNQT